MFCPQCGANNADNATVCVQCGRRFQLAAPPPTPLPVTGVVMPPGAPVVENYLVFAILATVFCCIPTGIVSIIYAAQVNAKLQAGDYGGAREASRNAKTWCWVSFGLGLASVVVGVLLGMLGVLSNLHH